MAAIVGLNATEGMDVYLMFVVCCIGSSPCTEVITYSGKSYHVVCVCLNVCDLETSTIRQLRPDLGFTVK